jgi:hypothetical protein
MEANICTGVDRPDVMHLRGGPGAPWLLHGCCNLFLREYQKVITRLPRLVQTCAGGVPRRCAIEMVEDVGGDQQVLHLIPAKEAWGM